jgi:hypothetical protein
MSDIRGRVSGNMIILDGPTDLPDGQEVVVTVEPVSPPRGEPRRPGAIKGKIIMAPDFDDLPPGFEEYVP